MTAPIDPDAPGNPPEDAAPPAPPDYPIGPDPFVRQRELGYRDPFKSSPAGRRREERYPCRERSLLAGSLGTLAATTMNVSRQGVLLAIDDARFQQAEARGGTRAYLDLLQRHADRGMVLVFPRPAFSRPADLVRWVAGFAAGARTSLLGLRFLEPLSEAEVRALAAGSMASGEPSSERVWEPEHAVE